MTLLSVVLYAICTSPAYAQTVEHESATEHESASGHEGGHESHKNFISAFAGITHAGRRKNGPALGVGYERLLTKSFSIGVLAEYTFGDADVAVYAVPFAYRVDRWKFLIAPGIEDGHHGTESLLRLGAEYAFEVNSWEVSPQAAVDFVDGDEVFILGVVIGKGF